MHVFCFLTRSISLSRSSQDGGINNKYLLHAFKEGYIFMCKLKLRHEPRFILQMISIFSIKNPSRHTYIPTSPHWAKIFISFFNWYNSRLKFCRQEIAITLMNHEQKHANPLATMFLKCLLRNRMICWVLKLMQGNHLRAHSHFCHAMHTSNWLQLHKLQASKNVLMADLMSMTMIVIV